MAFMLNDIDSLFRDIWAERLVNEWLNSNPLFVGACGVDPDLLMDVGL